MAGKVGIHVDDFSVVKLINGEYSISFFDALKNHSHDELISTARTGSNDVRFGDYADRVNTNASIIFDNKIKVSTDVGLGSYAVGYAYAELILQDINVYGYDTISFSGNQKKPKTIEESKSDADGGYNTNWKTRRVSNLFELNGESINNSDLGVIDIGGEDKISIHLRSGGVGVGSHSAFVSDADAGHVEITDIEIQ
jgi:hypothetical protein